MQLEAVAHQPTWMQAFVKLPSAKARARHGDHSHRPQQADPCPPAEGLIVTRGMQQENNVVLEG